MRISRALLQVSPRQAPRAAIAVDRVRCVLMREQRYLLAQHNSRRRQNRSRWGLAGGRVRDRENPEQCLRREIMFTHPEVVQLASAGRLRTGFALAAITAFERQRTSLRE